MKFHRNTAEIFVPDGASAGEALARTTHLAVAAHPDDIEIMAAGPVLECFRRSGLWFTGVVVTDGRAAPRRGKYAGCTDDEMRRVRIEEQRRAAMLGEYAAQVMLDHPSRAVRGEGGPVVKDLAAILEAARPRSVYTHNLADRHDTHVAVALKTVDAIRSLPRNLRPQTLHGCEVWRSLDWLADGDRVAFNLSGREDLQTALLEAFDSQIGGGKRYDLAAMGRRRANAVFFDTHEAGGSLALSLGMDMTALILDDTLDPGAFIQESIRRFMQEVTERIRRIL